jgi:hypothetical protein
MFFMSDKIHLKTRVRLGVVPTHLRFVGCLVPDDAGRYPRDESGEIKIVAGMRELCVASRVPLGCVQISVFPGCHEGDLDEMITELRALGLDVDLIMMLGGVNPMNPADEDAVVGQLLPGMKAAVKHGIGTVSSTSIEGWMFPGETERAGMAFDEAVAQNVKVHRRVIDEARLLGSSVQSWHIEFLRPGEFQTFTNIDRGRAFVQAANAALGNKFFKLIVDAAHCGNSGLSIDHNSATIRSLGASDELGAFHATPPTTRGCLSTDNGWIGALLAAAASTGKLQKVYVEMFHHQDAALQPLRDLEPGFGIDTRDGRSYVETMADGLADIARRLNNLRTRGILTD